MHFSDRNWMQVEEYLKKDDRVILVLGATEQHAYLSLLTDSKIPLALAEAAAEKTGVLVAPPLHFGSSPYFLAYPGTISLRSSTLMSVVEDIVRSLHGQGFRRFLALNGHGGNRIVSALLHELANDLPGLKMRWYDWWLSVAMKEVAAKHDLQQGHANWEEAFSFNRVADLPAEDKPKVDASEIVGAEEIREAVGDGSFGGPYQVDEAIMDELFEGCLAEILDLIKFE